MSSCRKLRIRILRLRRLTSVPLQVSGIFPIFVLCYRRIWCFRLQICHRRRRIEGMTPLLGVSRRMDASGSVPPMTSLVSKKDGDGMLTGSSSGDGRGPIGSITSYGWWHMIDCLQTRSGGSGRGQRTDRARDVDILRR
ncbi:hypothetical protein LINPERHAP1_LOCUS1867 [Linum perenne]